MEWFFFLQYYFLRSVFKYLEENIIHLSFFKLNGVYLDIGVLVILTN